MKNADILIIEDDAANAFMFQEVLRMSHPAYYADVETSLFKAEALIRASPDKYKLVILDCGLDDAGGLEGLKRMLEVFPGLLVGMVTGNPDQVQRWRALDLGAVFYLIKPPADLHDTVREALAVVASRKRIERALVQAEYEVLLKSEINRITAAKKTLLDKKSKIAIVTAAIVAATAPFISGLWDVIKAIFKAIWGAIMKH